MFFCVVLQTTTYASDTHKKLAQFSCIKNFHASYFCMNSAEHVLNLTQESFRDRHHIFFLRKSTCASFWSKFIVIGITNLDIVG